MNGVQYETLKDSPAYIVPHGGISGCISIVLSVAGGEVSCRNIVSTVKNDK